MSDSVYINANLFSWHSTILKIGDENFSGFDNITYAQRRVRGKGWGMSRSGRPRGRTSGKMETDPIKLKGMADTCQLVRAYLQSIASDQTSYGNVIVPISLQLFEPNLGEIFRLFKDCVLTEENGSHEEGSDPTKDELSFDVMWIETNGGTLFDSSLQVF